MASMGRDELTVCYPAGWLHSIGGRAYSHDGCQHCSGHDGCSNYGIAGGGYAMKGVEQIDCLYDMVLRPMNLLGLGAHRYHLVHELAGDILEVGVGTGLNLVYYGPVARVTGIDPNRELLNAARGRAGRRGYLLQAADAQALPFADRSFDAVVSTLVFCTIPAPLAALQEIGRVLRPGGRLLQLEHTRTGRDRPDAILDLIAPTWQRIAGGCHVNRDTVALVAAAGWRVQQHERHAGGFIRILISEPPA